MHFHPVTSTTRYQTQLIHRWFGTHRNGAATYTDLAAANQLSDLGVEVSGPWELIDDDVTQMVEQRVFVYCVLYFGHSDQVLKSESLAL